MQASHRIKAFIGREEALVLVAFSDRGTPAVGFSHHDRTLALGHPIEIADAVALLDADCRVIEIVLSRALTVPLLQHEFDALVSLAYNEGCGAIARSELVKALNQGDRSRIANLFLSYEHPGRRAREERIFAVAEYGDLSRIPLFRGNPRASSMEWIPWPGAPIEEQTNAL